MKNISFKTVIQGIIILFLTIFIAKMYIERSGDIQSSSYNKDHKIQITDDSNYKISLKEPAKRIISLYSAHTENLFSLGLDEEIIGVGISESYPHLALSKEVFDYHSDAEKVISARPDLVIIRPFIERKNPNFVQALKKAGITVVSLYPNNFNEFQGYIDRLSILTGTEEKAKELFNDYNQEVESIEKLTKVLLYQPKVYFESSDRGYKTITEDSMAARAIHIAGGFNIATDAVPIEEGSSIAEYGLERIIEKGKDIDIFVTQRGIMGAGGNYHSISIRPGFHSIKAIKDKRVLEINQKIISSPTFRQIKGIRELARYLHPQIFNDYSQYNTDKPMTRREFASLTVLFMKKPIFVPTSKYFDKEYRGHKYGFFKDVHENDEAFDYIETAVISGYIDGVKKDEEEYFYPGEYITKEEVAKFIFLIGDYKNINKEVEIIDRDQLKSPKLVEILVDNGVLKTNNGMFEPDKNMSGKEIINLLAKIKQ